MSLLAGLTLLAFAVQDETPCPVELFKDAAKGDWLAYREESVTRFKGGEQKQGTTHIWTVKSVTPEVLVFSIASRADDGSCAEVDRTLPRKKPLTLDRLLDTPWTISDLKTEDDAHVIEERKFQCKKLSFAQTDHMAADKEISTTLWLDPDVGIVEHVEKQTSEEREFTVERTWRLAGTGRGDETTWGKRPEDK